MKNGIKIVFFISLAINMFLIGFFAHQFINKSDIPPNIPRLSSCSFLPKHSYKDIKSHLSYIRKLRREIFETLRKEPFDKALIASKFDKLIEERNKEQKKFYSAIIDYIEKLPQKERNKFLEDKFLKKFNHPTRHRRTQ